MALLSGKPDAVCAAAVDLARDAAVQAARTDNGEPVGPQGPVGEHLGTTTDGERLVTHLFKATLPGYRGWHWAVTVARASRSKTPTVDEVVLLPGDGALLAPQWVPYSQRLRPGDLAPGDLLPTEPDDPRLVPAWFVGDPSLDDTDPEETAGVALEVGLGRQRVLSPEGRLDAAERWRDGDGGPDTPMAVQAPGPCATCAFLIPLRGSMRAAFGVCANEYAVADGRVVTVDHGCGAHSDATAIETHHADPSGEVYDDSELVVEPR